MSRGKSEGAKCTRQALTGDVEFDNSVGKERRMSMIGQWANGSMDPFANMRNMRNKRFTRTKVSPVRLSALPYVTIARPNLDGNTRTRTGTGTKTDCVSFPSVPCPLHLGHQTRPTLRSTATTDYSVLTPYICSLSVLGGALTLLIQYPFDPLLSLWHIIPMTVNMKSSRTYTITHMQSASATVSRVVMNDLL